MNKMGRICVLALNRLWLITVFTIIPLLTFAQQDDPGEPCDDSDPLDNACPLDSWVYMAIFVVIAVVLTGMYLRKQAIKDLQEREKQHVASELTEVSFR